MSPAVVTVPLAILAGGIAGFLLVPLDFTVRVALLTGDVLAAGLVGFVLWHRSRR